MSSPKIAVMGAGGWGSAFSLILGDAGHATTLWSRRAEVAEEINATRRNEAYLAGVDLPAGLRATDDPDDALAGADIVVLAVPSQQLRENLQHWNIPRHALVVSLAKGIEEGSGLRMSQVIAEHGVDTGRIAVLSGPNLANEIAERQPAAAVVAAERVEVAKTLQRCFVTQHFRVYTITDVVGCELGGATKNVIALGVGMGIGMGFGANSMAVLITRGLAETERLGVAMGADPHTFAGLAGMGDLVATCSSPLSRNRRFGELLGRGYTVAEGIKTSRGVAEGVRSSPMIKQLAIAHGVDMPIVDAVVEVVSGRTTPAEALARLMERVAKPER